MNPLLKRLSPGFDRTNALVAIGVWLITLFIYLLTKAPTLSLWDCGEFIACSYTLGIPHPPGTPFYILVGRIFSLIPLFEDISARINFLSSLCSSIAAMFAYLTGVRILRYWFQKDTSLYGRVLTYAGAACGALFLAFGRTQWNNSVESEVYGMSMMLVFGIIWLILVYFEYRGTFLGDKIILLVVYLAFLGIGVHMTTFLIFPVAMMVFVLKKGAPARYWFLLAVCFAAELYLILALSSRVNEIPYQVAIAIVFIFYIFYMLSYERIPRLLLAIGFGLLLASMPVVVAMAGWHSPIWSTIGLVSFIVVLLGSLTILLIQFYRHQQGEETNSHSIVAALFVVAAGLMAVLMFSSLRGYSVFLILSGALIAVVALLVWRHVRLLPLIALAGTSLVILGVREYVIGSLVALVLVIILGRIFKMEGWKSAAMIVLVAAAGYSVHAYLPVRSSLHPNINENNPSRSLHSTVSFLERKQYGSQSMTSRMFTRRAEWVNQFGEYRRMGFWSFFKEQYGIIDLSVFDRQLGPGGLGFLLLFILGLFGVWEACRRKPEVGVPFAIFLLLSTVGLILYMNFADGTRQLPSGADYCEVRDRDYFFTPGFMMFGLAIGLGIAAFIQYIRDVVRKFGLIPRRCILAACLVLFLLPIYAIAGNYNDCDRSRNFIAYDYAWNLLISADQNAVLFTNGDNDTFPLWCAQEVYGIRTDVRVVNLSLANADWYIKQVRDQMGLELGWTDGQIDSLRSFRYRDGRRFRIQDQVINAIIRHNWGKVPINYCFTVSSGARTLGGRNIDSLLEMSGMMFRLTDSTGGIRIDTDRSLMLFQSVDGFKYRGWNDPDIHKTETANRITRNVAGSCLMLAEGLRREDRMNEAESIMKYAVEKIPHATNAVEVLGELYMRQGRPESLDLLIANNHYADQRVLKTLLARAYRKVEQLDKARDVLTDILENDPRYRDALDELMRLLIKANDIQGVVTTLQNWLVYNPDDQEMREMLRDLLDNLSRFQQQRGDSL